MFVSFFFGRLVLDYRVFRRKYLVFRNFARKQAFSRPVMHPLRI